MKKQPKQTIADYRKFKLNQTGEGQMYAVFKSGRRVPVAELLKQTIRDERRKYGTR